MSANKVVPHAADELQDRRHRRVADYLLSSLAIKTAIPRVQRIIGIISSTKHFLLLPNFPWLALHYPLTMSKPRTGLYLGLAAAGAGGYYLYRAGGDAVGAKEEMKGGFSQGFVAM